MVRPKKKVVKFHLFNFINRNFLLAVRDVIAYKNFILGISALFLFSIILGYAFPTLFEKEVLSLLSELFEKTQGLGPIELTRFIMANNIGTAFFGMIIGVFFAVFSAILIFINGYVLGFVANRSIMIEGPLILWRLVPHGIFEIPAILISMGLGVRLGLFLVLYRGKHKLQVFFSWVVDALRVFVFVVVPLLVIAGIIEGVLIALIR